MTYAKIISLLWNIQKKIRRKNMFYYITVSFRRVIPSDVEHFYHRSLPHSFPRILTTQKTRTTNLWLQRSFWLQELENSFLNERKIKEQVNRLEVSKPIKTCTLYDCSMKVFWTCSQELENSYLNKKLSL